MSSAAETQRWSDAVVSVLLIIFRCSVPKLKRYAVSRLPVLDWLPKYSVWDYGMADRSYLRSQRRHNALATRYDLSHCAGSFNTPLSVLSGTTIPVHSNLCPVLNNTYKVLWKIFLSSDKHIEFHLL